MATATAPVTTAGRRSGTSAIPQENCAGFDDLLASYTADLKPAGCHEQFLVRLIARARFNIDRYQRLEALALDRILTQAESGAGDSPDEVLLDALTDARGPLAAIRKLIDASERSYFRAFREFTTSRKGRLQNEATQRKNALEELTFGPVAAIAQSFRNRREPTPPPTLAPAPAQPRVPRFDLREVGNPALRL